MATIPDDPNTVRPLNPTDFASAVTAITSAFGDPTRRDIYLFVHEQAEGVTATEVAEHFELHPNVARHHLDKLAGGGYLAVTSDRGPGAGAGRPSKRYTPTTSQVALDLPMRHDDIVITLLSRALAMLSPEQATTMAEEVGVEYGRVMAHAMGNISATQRSFSTALQAVADALTAHGFAAHAERHEDVLRIVNDHCPFGGSSIENPVICAVDRGLVKGMLAELYGNTSPELESSVALGDPECVTSIDA